jgi:EmrB/QacA subfamily drug resistance transporter
LAQFKVQASSSAVTTADQSQADANQFGSLTKQQLVGTVIGLQLTLLLAAVDQTIVSTAMPRIVAQLNGFERYAWVTTAYMLTSTVSIPIFGRLSDLVGRKWVLLSGAAFFVLASLLCGAAGRIAGLPLDGMSQLILFRALQGLGGGIIMVLVFSALGDLFPPAVRGKYMGLFSGIWAIASLIGPALGGWLTEQYSWRSVFYINLPVGILACGALYCYFPSTKVRRAKPQIDLAGVATLIACLVPLLLGVNALSTGSGNQIGASMLVVFAALMIWLFVFVEKRAREPIVPPVLLGIRDIQLAVLVFTSLSVVLFSVTLFLPLFMQVVIGLSPTKTGSLFAFLGISMASASALSGQLMSRFGRYRLLALSGGLIGTVAVGALSQFQAGTTEAELVFALIGVGIGLGMIMPVFTIVIQNAAPAGMIGAATALGQFFRSVGGTIGAAVLGSLMQSQYIRMISQSELPGLTPALYNELSNPTRLTQIRAQLLNTAPAGSTALVQIEQLLKISSNALAQSLHLIFSLSLLCLLITLAAILAVKEKPLRSN